MAIKVQIPPPMREATGGSADVEAAGATVELVLRDLIAKHPPIGPKLFKDGKLQMHVNIYLNEEDIRFLDELESPVKDGDVIALIPAVAGGSQDDDEDEDGEFEEAPEGAALLPMIPEELGVSPMFLAMLHSYVFFEGSTDLVVDEDIAAENLEYMAAYLQRLKGPELQRTREDIIVLVAFAKEEKWPAEVVDFLQKFLETNGVK